MSNSKNKKRKQKTFQNRRNMEGVNYSTSMSAKHQKKVILKVILLGDSGVGKTSLMTRYVQDSFNHDTQASIGVGISSKVIDINAKKIRLQIWDTAGQERFKSLSSAFFRGADGCILVYDVTSIDSFNNVNTWYNEFLLQAAPNDPDNFPIVVLGNKVDCARQVPTRQASQWCQQKNNIPFMETSALDTTNVDRAFRTIAEKVLSVKGELVINNDPVSFEVNSWDERRYSRKHSKKCSCN